VASRFECQSKVCCARLGDGFLEISAYQTVLTVVVVVVVELVVESQGAHVDSVVLRNRVSLQTAFFENALGRMSQGDSPIKRPSQTVLMRCAAHVDNLRRFTHLI
jgi:hypothetical protein